ncbi:asparaginase [Phaeobacter sp. HS012]|uniref:asparaginase domain-containing protein n=1 Tax=Phaeobacter TaxID=302485 RepID=UPI000160D505|nr:MULTISPECIES: asparaginase domain-containing protein [Phaeobacter]AUQ54779.1 L-asparaginase 2 precursor [Phaeobacter inhibens]AUQ78795.1 L-asparaginase 2 precursor [Phaeobacter inhibens]AUR04132.1 L-asparaginase 2 precursor [Phaeobacter inhibens]AUR15954.1 L-asparaginase 2 precursor [Phaeobacter inhibens]AXT42784.1 asparaginase [Phaeobacter inhibens]
MKELRIIATGGTIDKVHDTRTEALSFRSNSESHLSQMLKIGRCYFPVVEVLMLKDSLDFDDADREAILQTASNSAENALIITHGTGTMDVTAQFLDGQIPDKTVVLTGAMRPFSLSASDGDFNLGSAVIAAQLLESGVWGVMNGRVFPAGALRKNTALGRFDD